MASGRNIDAVLAEVERLIQVWTENPSFSMGEVTLDELKAAATKLRTVTLSRDETQTKLTKLVDDANDQAKLVNDLVVRGRSAIKGIFGPDSAQYDQVGGTRASARKPRSSKKPKTP